jgi:hypothetical protein
MHVPLHLLLRAGGPAAVAIGLNQPRGAGASPTPPPRQAPSTAGGQRPTGHGKKHYQRNDDGTLTIRTLNESGRPVSSTTYAGDNGQADQAIAPWDLYPGKLAGQATLSAGGKLLFLGPKTNRAFWSGEGAMNAAAQHAVLQGGRTIEQLPVGKVLTVATKLVNNVIRDQDQARRYMGPVWRAASRRFAKEAEGPVDVFLVSNVRPTGIWKTIEEPVLTGKNVIRRHHVGR